jgi:hypothetical protein
MIRRNKPTLDMLLRQSILDITQGVATLLALIMFLMGSGAGAIMLAMLALAVVGIVGGNRITGKG